MTRVLLNHGLANWRTETQWMHRAATALRKLGHQVAYPQFPSPEEPLISQWQSLLVAEAAMLHELGDDSGELIFIGHSLGALNFLKAAEDGRLPVRFDRTLLVAPADPQLLPDLPVGSLDVTSSALKEAVARATADLIFVASDADPWLPRGIRETFAEPLSATAIVIPGAKHISDKDGWGPWQGVIDWVLDPGADLTKR